MVGFGQAVLDAVLVADTVEDVAREVPAGGGIGRERDAVVGQHGVDAVREGLDDLAQESGAVQLGVGVEEGDVGELGHPVDGQEHKQLAFGQAQLAGVDVDVADLGLGEAAPLGRFLLVSGQAGDAMADQAAVQGAAGELGDALPQAAQHVVERQEGAPPELDDDGLLGFGQGAAAGLGSHHRVGGAVALAPLQDGFGVQAKLGGEGAGRRLRRLELGSNTRRRAG